MSDTSSWVDGNDKSFHTPKPNELNYNETKGIRKLDNLNEAVQDTAQLIIPNFDNFNYFVRSFEFPSVEISAVDTPFFGNPNKQIGDTISYGDLSVEIHVDEDLGNITALLEWVKNQSFLDNVSDRYVDITIMWKTRNLKNQKEIILHNAFVTNISGFHMEIGNSEQNPISTSVTFSYQYLTINGVDLVPTGSV